VPPDGCHNLIPLFQNRKGRGIEYPGETGTPFFHLFFQAVGLGQNYLTFQIGAATMPPATVIELPSTLSGDFKKHSFPLFSIPSGFVRWESYEMSQERAYFRAIIPSPVADVKGGALAAV
jgi:hypothetical protein